jgi:hypothetical protein
MGSFVFKYPPTVSATTTTLTYTVTTPINTLVLSALNGKTLVLVTLNTITLIPQTPPPTSQGYSYDAGTNTLTFGATLLPGYVLQIIYT